MRAEPPVTKAPAADPPPRGVTALAVSRRTFAGAVLIGLIGMAALVAAGLQNGRGMEWKVGPESLISLHKASTHFPIGLLLASAAFEAGSLVLRRDDLRVTSFWTLLAGAAGAVFAAVLGFLGNPFAGDASEMGQKVLLHQKAGVVTAALFTVIALWRVARRGRAGRAEGAIQVLVTLAGIALVSATGYMGGHIME